MEEESSFRYSIRRTVLKEKIQRIYENSHQNYGTPKITAELQKTGEHIAVKTVGNYMRQMGIKAQWIKPYTQTTIDSDLSQKLKNILKQEFNPEYPDAVWCSDIIYLVKTVDDDHHLYELPPEIQNIVLDWIFRNSNYWEAGFEPVWKEKIVLIVYERYLHEYKMT